MSRMNTPMYGKWNILMLRSRWNGAATSWAISMALQEGVLCFPSEKTPVATRGIGGDGNQQDDVDGGAEEEKVVDTKMAA